MNGVPLRLHLAIDHFVEAFAVESSCFSNLGYTLVFNGVPQGHNEYGRVVIFVGIGQVLGQLILAQQVVKGLYSISLVMIQTSTSLNIRCARTMSRD